MGTLVGAVTVILAIAIGGYAFLALSPTMNYYLDTTREYAASGSVYAGEGLELNATSVDWGSIPPDSTTNTTIRVSNMLDDPMTLYLNSFNWVPANASDYMAITWDDNGFPLLGRTYRDVVLTLTVFANCTAETGITDFNCDMTISGVWDE